MAVDRQMVARTVQELRSALPEADDLLAGLLRVAEASRIVLEVDGAGLTLIHADGPPRWVAATDAAMELLAQVQHDFGEGPYLQAYAQDRAVVVQDLGAAPVWVRLAAVVGQLRVLAVLSVPIRLVGQPVGTLDVYSTQPRAWTAHEVEGAGEFAAVAGELVQTSVTLASRELEVAQLRQALTSRVWIEQAKGVLAATQGTDPEAAFQQLRARARSSSRKLVEVAQEVIQDAQRQRLAALALDDARVQQAEARAQSAEQALEAAQADLTQRRAALNHAEVTAEERDRVADERNHAAEERGPLMSATASPMNATGRRATRTDLDVLEPAWRPLAIAPVRARRGGSGGLNPPRRSRDAAPGRVRPMPSPGGNTTRPDRRRRQGRSSSPPAPADWDGPVAAGGCGGSTLTPGRAGWSR